MAVTEIWRLSDESYFVGIGIFDSSYLDGSVLASKSPLVDNGVSSDSVI